MEETSRKTKTQDEDRALISPRLSPNKDESPSCVSLRLSHNFSLSFLYVGWMPCPNQPPLPHFWFLLPHLPPHPSHSPLQHSSSLLFSPSSLSPDSGRVCRLRHFCQSVCKDQRKVLQCRLSRRLCNAASGPWPDTHRNAPFIKRCLFFWWHHCEHHGRKQWLLLYIPLTDQTLLPHLVSRRSSCPIYIMKKCLLCISMMQLWYKRDHVII